jgi:hypothetical protein
MAAESLVLFNPRPRRRRRNKRRMPPALRRYWASRRGKRLSNPRARRRRANPRVHSYYRRPAVRHHHRHNPRRGYAMRRRSYRRLRNPRGDFMNTLAAGAIGAGGALLLNWAYGAVSSYLPAGLQTGLAQTAVLGVGALGLGYLVGRFVSQDLGQDVAYGGLAVVIYNAGITMLSQSGITMTNNLSGYADYTPRRLGAYMTGTPRTAGFRMGAYMTGTPRTAGFRQGLGYVSPASVVRPALGAYVKPAPMNVAPMAGNWGDGM